MADQIGTLPPAPIRADGANFSAIADTFLGALPDFGTEANILAVGVEDDAAAAAQSVTDCQTEVTLATVQSALATTEADRAETAADASASSANFKGEWDDLTGAANIPFSVFHNNSNWNLINNLADVTTSEPSVAADWERVSGGSLILLSSVTLSTDTSVVIVFPSGFTSFLVKMIDVDQSSNSNVTLTVSTDGGSTFNTGGTDYRYSGQQTPDTTSTVATASSSGTNRIRFGAGDTVNLNIEIFNPLISTPTMIRIDGTTISSGVTQATTCSAQRVAASVVDAISIANDAAGTLDSGLIQLYGII